MRDQARDYYRHFNRDVIVATTDGMPSTPRHGTGYHFNESEQAFSRRQYWNAIMMRQLPINFAAQDSQRQIDSADESLKCRCHQPVFSTKMARSMFREHFFLGNILNAARPQIDRRARFGRRMRRLPAIYLS